MYAPFGNCNIDTFLLSFIVQNASELKNVVARILFLSWLFESILDYVTMYYRYRITDKTNKGAIKENLGTPIVLKLAVSFLVLVLRY